jgi:hypothetical protein
MLRAMSHGFLLHPGNSRGRHRLCGLRMDHEDIAFPVCPRCKKHQSPLLRLDFDDPQLAKLGLWTGDTVLLLCHNGCENRTTEGMTWDYSNPLAPVVLDPSSINSCFGPCDGADYEFEEIELALVPADPPDPDLIVPEARVGGEPAWLQDEKAVACPTCEQTLPMLAQFAEGERRPRRLGHPNQELGEPFIRFYFGCAACRVIVTLRQLD